MSKSKTNLVLFGSGGYGKEVLWILKTCSINKNKFSILGFLDENKSLWGKNILGVPVLGGLNWLKNSSQENLNCVICVGDPVIRKTIFKKLDKLGLIFPKIIHSSCILDNDKLIGEGSVISTNVSIESNVKIGKHAFVNMNSSIAHDSDIGNFVTICPGSHINGNNIIECGSFLGSGSITKEKISIGKWSIIGAGSVLINNVKSFSLYVGNPALLKRSIKSKRPVL
jgi:sugar O-acyltransferase (sialic acid O-acetyltransferase NeuD family)